MLAGCGGGSVPRGETAAPHQRWIQALPPAVAARANANCQDLVRDAQRLATGCRGAEQALVRGPDGDRGAGNPDPGASRESPAALAQAAHSSAYERYVQLFDPHRAPAAAASRRERTGSPPDRSQAEWPRHRAQRRADRQAAKDAGLTGCNVDFPDTVDPGGLRLRPMAHTYSRCAGRPGSRTSSPRPRSTRGSRSRSACAGYPAVAILIGHAWLFTRGFGAFHRQPSQPAAGPHGRAGRALLPALGVPALPADDRPPDRRRRCAADRRLRQEAVPAPLSRLLGRAHRASRSFPGLFGVWTHNWWAFYSLTDFFDLNNAHSACPDRPALSCGLPQSWTLGVDMSFYVALPFYAARDGAARARTGRKSWMKTELGLLAALAATCCSCRAPPLNMRHDDPGSGSASSVTSTGSPSAWRSP